MHERIDTPQYDAACVGAAQITNILGSDYPGGRAELFGRVLFVILAAIYSAQGVVMEEWTEPSDN